MRVLEVEAQLGQVVSQNDLLHDKVRVLTDSFYSLEAEHTRTVADLQAALATARQQLSHCVAPGTGRLALPASAAQRAEQELALTGRCADLERERAALAGQAVALQRKLDAAQRGVQPQCSPLCMERRQHACAPCTWCSDAAVLEGCPDAQTCCLGPARKLCCRALQARGSRERRCRAADVSDARVARLGGAAAHC